MAQNRDDLKSYLAENGIGTLIQWGGMAIHHYTNLGFDQKLQIQIPSLKMYYVSDEYIPVR